MLVTKPVHEKLCSLGRVASIILSRGVSFEEEKCLIGCVF